MATDTTRSSSTESPFYGIHESEEGKKKKRKKEREKK
jgi:hypothetical protein